MATAAAVSLLKLARSLRSLAKVPSRVAKPFAAYVTQQLQNGIRSGTDPYGKPFTPLRPATIRKKGHDRILQASLALLGTVRGVPLSGGGIGLDGGPWYGAFHISATKWMVERGYLPVNVMPAKWRAELQRLNHDEVKGTLS